MEDIQERETLTTEDAVTRMANVIAYLSLQQEEDTIDVVRLISLGTARGIACKLHAQLEDDVWFEDRGIEMTKDRKVAVSVYAVTRHYGGPEEGGWWYNWQDFTGYSERCTVAQVDAVKARLLALFADDAPEYSIDSMANHGEPEYHAITEGTAGASQSKERPRYS